MEEGSFISIFLSFCATTSTHPPILGRSVLCAGKVATKPNRSDHEVYTAAVQLQKTTFGVRKQ